MLSATHGGDATDNDSQSALGSGDVMQNVLSVACVSNVGLTASIPR